MSANKKQAQTPINEEQANQSEIPSRDFLPSQALPINQRIQTAEGWKRNKLKQRKQHKEKA